MLKTEFKQTLINVGDYTLLKYYLTFFFCTGICKIFIIFDMKWFIVMYS